MGRRKAERNLVLDDTFLNIIRQLSDGNKRLADIAKDLGIAENTVRSRVNKLMESGILRVVGLVDPDLLPGHYTSYIGFKVKPDQARRIAEELSRLKGVIATSCVAGSFDIISYVLFNDEYTMQEFLFEELAKIHGIVSVEQFQVIKGFNRRARYVL